MSVPRSHGTVGRYVDVQVTGALNMLVQNSTQLESNIVSVERMVEYITLPQEVGVCVCARARVRACVGVRMCMFVCVCAVSYTHLTLPTIDDV